MSKLDIVTDEEAGKFHNHVNELTTYLKSVGKGKYIKTIGILLNDNIKLFNRIQELENGNTSSKNKEE